MSERTVNVMPWGPMSVVLHGAPPGFGHKVTVTRIAETKEWLIEVTLTPPPEQRHWTQGDS